MDTAPILPDSLEGFGPVRAFDVSKRAARVTARHPTGSRGQGSKPVLDLDAAFELAGIRDGSVLSFHHHLRNGDGVLNLVLDKAAQLGLRGLTVAPSSLFPVHAPLVEHIKSGVVTRICTDYVNGAVGDAIIQGHLGTPLILQSHGGRARAITSGELAIDAAFIAAPVADRFGGATGGIGRAACGPLGYAMVDANHAATVIVVAEEISQQQLDEAEIGADRTDCIVLLDRIGDPSGIESGTTRPAQDATSARIASLCVAAIKASSVMRDGFSFQTGTGGISLAVAQRIGAAMIDSHIKGSFVSGGISAASVELVRAGLFERIHNVQSFDLEAVRSFHQDPWHHVMSAAQYASPLVPDAICNQLDVMILGAAEIDRQFNVNVTTGSNGRLLGGPGGHPDTAAGAKLAIVTTRTTAHGFAKLVDRVNCITTPGCDIDLIVTERGLVVHPQRADLADRFTHAGLPLVAMDDLIARDSKPDIRIGGGRPLIAVEYRDGSILDVVRQGGFG